MGLILRALKLRGVQQNPDFWGIEAEGNESNMVFGYQGGSRESFWGVID